MSLTKNTPPTKFPFYCCVYISSTTSVSLCTTRLSVQKTDLAFPPQISYKCPQCKTEHGFKAGNKNLIGSPKILAAFENWCSQNNVVQNVTIN